MVAGAVVPQMAREIRMSGVDTTVDDGDDHARCCGVERGEGVLPGRLSGDAPKGPLMAVERIVDDPRRSKDPILFSRLDNVAGAAEVHENTSDVLLRCELDRDQP